MTPLARGIVIATVQALVLVAVAGWFLYERDTLPRAWGLTAGVDPQLPIRGRYVDLRLVITLRGSPLALQEARERKVSWTVPRAEGAALSGDLLPDGETAGAQYLSYDPQGERWLLWQPVAFFLSEHEPDPTRLAAGDELWAEVTVPARGAPRPIRLEVRHAAPAPAAAPE